MKAARVDTHLEPLPTRPANGSEDHARLNGTYFAGVRHAELQRLDGEHVKRNGVGLRLRALTMRRRVSVLPIRRRNKETLNAE